MDIHIFTLIQFVNFNVRLKELLHIMATDRAHARTNFKKILKKSAISLNIIESSQPQASAQEQMGST